MSSQKILIVGYFVPVIFKPVQLTPILSSQENPDFWFVPDNKEINIKSKIQEILTSPLDKQPLGASRPIILKRPVEWKGGEKLVRSVDKDTSEIPSEYIVEKGPNFTVFQFEKDKPYRQPGVIEAD